MSAPIPAKAMISKRWVAETLSNIAQDQDPLVKLREMLDLVLGSKKGNTLAARDATTQRIEELFKIRYSRWKNPEAKRWRLQSEQHEPPLRLRHNLLDLKKALYDDAAEATSRIAVDLMLIACKLHVMEMHPSHFSAKRQMTATRPATPYDSEEREMVMIFPEIELAVQVEDPKTKETVRVTGRADWGFGYTGRDGAAYGTFLVAIEAKRRSLFFDAESQLLAYLAIMRELRMRAGKTNAVTQGFYTDGERYCFMAINHDGTVELSGTYDVTIPGGEKSVFNFIVSILDSAIRCSPTVSPIKIAEQRHKEKNDYPGEVWEKIYGPYPAEGEEAVYEEAEYEEMPPL